MWIARRKNDKWNTVPVAGGTTTMQLDKGMLETGIMLSCLYATTLTGAGSAVRSISVPIDTITLKGDNNKVLQTWRASDLVRLAMIFEQTPYAGLVTPASAAAVATYSNLEAHIPIPFQQPHAGNGWKTRLPTWAYQNLSLEVVWGTVSHLFTNGGTLAGTIAFTASGQYVTQLDVGDNFVPPNLAPQIARGYRLSVNRYDETVQAAVASSALPLSLGTPPTADIRAAMIVAELTSTGEPTNTIINSLVWKENNSTNVHDLTWQALRADNSKLYGLALPAGVGVVDFADDGDIDNIYAATKKRNVSLFFNTAAVAGTIRVVQMTIEPAPFAALAARAG